MNFEYLKTNGGTISYSAGSTSLDPSSFRSVEDSSAKIGSAVHLFPELGKYFQKTPVVISCYPASLGSFDSVIYLDTYLRPVNFSRGLMLARELDTTCIILGQPLTVLDLLIKHCSNESSLPVPENILFALGGYFTPVSLEKTISSVLNPLNVTHDLLHAYGVAEIDFGCLLGMHRNDDGKAAFKIANSQVQVELGQGKLLLGKTTGDSLFETGDYAYWENESLIITPGQQRINQQILDCLEQWDSFDWKKRTGHVGRIKNNLVFQLREGESSENGTEIDFYDFSREFNMSWAAKPNWVV